MSACNRNFNLTVIYFRVKKSVTQLGKMENVILTEKTLGTHLQTLSPSLTTIQLYYDLFTERVLLSYIKQILRLKENRIVTFTLREVNFTEVSVAKFPKILIHFNHLKELTIRRKTNKIHYFKMFLPAFYYAIQDDNFHRKDKIELEFKSFYRDMLADFTRSHYILALIMTSFYRVKTFYSFYAKSVAYRHHFILCEKVTRKRKDFQYLIGSSYDDVPLEYRRFTEIYGGYLDRYHFKR